jgi:outer membrane protein OmpA-like peptidoglycan-associated protein
MFKSVNLVFPLFTFVSLFSFSQTGAVDDYFENFEFKKYTELESKQDTSLKTQLQLAQAYYYLNDFQSAKVYFDKVDFNRVENVNQLFYANSLKNNGDFDQAKDVVNAFLKQDSSSQSAKLLLQQIHFLATNKSTVSNYLVRNIETANDKAAQFSPYFWNEKVVFVSEKSTDKTSQPDVEYVSKSEEGIGLGKSVRPKSSLFTLNPETLVGESLLTLKDFHIGSSVFDPISNKWLVTLTPIVKKWNDYSEAIPRIYTADASSKKIKLVRIKGIGFEDGYGHPALTSDGKFMVFSVEKKGSKSQSDLYVSERKNGKWLKPKMLSSEVNSFADDVYPMIYKDSTLYFSSEGKVGFGGLDIYSIPFKNGITEGKATLLETPINSNADDYGYVVYAADANKGYFSSDRFDGKGDADLYSFEVVVPWKLLIEVKNDKNQKYTEAGIYLYVDDKMIAADKNGEFASIQLNQGQKYVLKLVTKDSTNITEINLPNISGRDTTIAFIIPSKKPMLEPVIKEIKETIAELVNSPFPESVYFEFDKSTIVEKEKKNLKLLIDYLTKNPDKKLVVTTFADERGDVLYNIDLTTKRAKEIYKYLVKNGINADRIKIQSLGEAEYNENCAPNCDETVHARYRRADFKVK